MIRGAVVAWGLAFAWVMNAGISEASFVAAEALVENNGPKIAALARLSPGPGSPEAMSLLRDGLKDPDPAVRAAAARVTHVIGLSSLLAELRQAIGGETDGDAAHEQAWAIADLDVTEGSDPALIAALGDPKLRRSVVRALLAGRGSRALALWVSLKPGFADDPYAIARALAEGLHRDSGSVFASLALRDGLEAVFAALLLSRELEVDASVAMAGTSAPSSRVRAVSYLTLARRGIAPAEGSPTVRVPENLEERVALHLFEAFRGGARTESFADLVGALGADQETRGRLRNPYQGARDAIRGLTPGERETFLRALGVEEKEIASARDRKFEARPATTTPTKAPSMVMKTLSGYPPDFTRSVLEATGCQGRPSAFDGVEATYRRGGRAASVSVLPTSLSANGCGEAARILGVNALATGDEWATLILPERPEFLTCFATPPGSVARFPQGNESARVGGNIKEPTKVRNVAPIYPGAARERRLQGIVIMEAAISPTGCVSGLKVLRKVDPALDLSALDAVSGWAYTPTLLNGVAVPVIMTVTVNFRLN